MRFWCFSDAFLMLFWCFSNESNETGFLSSWSWPCPKFQSPKRRRGRSQSKPIEEEAEANRSQSKKRPKRCVCCSPFTEKLASNFAVICEIDMWNRYVKSICEIAARAPPAMHGLAKKEGRSHPLFCNRFIIYIICKSGGYIIAPKSHLTAKTE